MRGNQNLSADDKMKKVPQHSDVMPIFLSKDDDPIESVKKEDIILQRLGGSSDKRNKKEEERKKKMFFFLSGKSGAGKDLAASYLSGKYGFKIFRLADPIKKYTSDLTLTSILDCYFKKDKVPKDMGDLDWDLGEYQQKMGSAFREGMHPKIFIFHLWKKMKITEWTNAVIVDGRLKNEYKFFVGKKAKTIRLNREFELRKPFLGKRDPNHITEVDLDDAEFDYVIENNSMKDDDLFREIDKIVKK